MIDTYATRRGRPVGTGLDDSRDLDRIAEIMSRKLDVTATGAIRLLGITEVSTIRRLRDKLKRRDPSLLRRYHATGIQF